jgi:CBS domain-containing protein
MRARDLVRSAAVAVPRSTTVADAAKALADAGVGSLVVVDDGAVVGIVTDRDLVLRALAARMPLDVPIESVMTPDVVTVAAEDSLEDVYALFGRVTFRRLPVIDPDDGRRVIGVISVDDLLLDVTRRLRDISGPIVQEIKAPHRESPFPVPSA